MTGTVTFSQDATRLTQQVSTLKAWLLGTGATDGQCKDILKTEAGLLAWEISEQLGPRTLPEGKAKIERDVHHVFFPIDENIPFFTGRKTGTQSDFQWLFAYKANGRSFLMGADTADIPGRGADLQKIYYEQAKLNRGQRFQDLGEVHPEKNPGRKPRKGWQHAMKINRVVVSVAAYERLKRAIEKQLGQLRASFARTAEAFNARKRIPSWISNQIGEVVWNGKSIFNDAGLNHPTEPFIEFGSRAKGVESNPMIAEKIHNAFKRRQFIMQKKIRDLAKGAKYVWETGQTYFPKGEE